MICRHCGSSLEQIFVDLGHAPPSNAYLSEQDLSRPETYYPLKVLVCDRCWLVQTAGDIDPGIFFNNDYAYFASTSSSWVAHAKNYTENIICELGLNQNSHVVEIGANDGYLLKNFCEQGIPCLGIEPTESTADAAELLGIPVLREFFDEKLGKKLAGEDRQADLVIGNNVYAHVPDINGFTLGLRAMLKPRGTITLEFPHLMNLIKGLQFDTIYHEHFSYLSLYTVCRIFETCGLRVWKVEEISTHGGSLRIYGCHNTDPRVSEDSVSGLLRKEYEFGLQTLNTYQGFQSDVLKIKTNLLSFLIERKKEGKTVAAYGAAAKGSTLLNFAGVRPDLVSCVADAAISKQGKYLPGSHLPIISPEQLIEMRPDLVLILPWNLADEIQLQNDHLSQSGAQFFTTIPELTFL